MYQVPPVCPTIIVRDTSPMRALPRVHCQCRRLMSLEPPLLSLQFAGCPDSGRSRPASTGLSACSPGRHLIRCADHELAVVISPLSSGRNGQNRGPVLPRFYSDSPGAGSQAANPPAIPLVSAAAQPAGRFAPGCCRGPSLMLWRSPTWLG